MYVDVQWASALTVLVQLSLFLFCASPSPSRSPPSQSHSSSSSSSHSHSLSQSQSPPKQPQNRCSPTPNPRCQPTAKTRQTQPSASLFPQIAAAPFYEVMPSPQHPKAEVPRGASTHQAVTSKNCGLGESRSGVLDSEYAQATAAGATIGTAAASASLGRSSTSIPALFLFFSSRDPSFPSPPSLC